MDQEIINHSPQGDGKALLGIPAVVPDKAAAVRGREWSRLLLAQLPYERRTCDGRLTYGITMPGGYWVEQWLIQDSWKMFWRGAHLLNASRKHSAEALCADPSWSHRNRGQRLKLGRCFKYFAVHGVLPIALANPGKSGPRKYFIDQALAAIPVLH